MSVHLFTVTWESETALPKDAMVNTWYFEGSGTDPANVGDMLEDFYNADPSGLGYSIGSYFSDDIVTGDYTIKGYDLADAKPRAPMYESTRSLDTISTGDGLPPEVALCFSYHADYVSGTAPARRRGRVYLGGLATASSSGGRPVGALTLVIAAAGRDLLVASNSAVNWSWVQYSQTTSTGNNVVGGWVDDAWDTQRRRGIDASSRETWTATTPTTP